MPRFIYHFQIKSHFQPVTLSILLSTESPTFPEETRSRIKGGTDLLLFIPCSLYMCSFDLVFIDTRRLPSRESVPVRGTDLWGVNA